ncbi:MAG: hypothetical protein DRO12_03750 [Thermoprotei archaeon]|nr:MAG: hypothetical protein DRO12_03750 [Thermoprotei archaeon]
MKTSYRALLFVLCLNLGVLLVNGVSSIPGGPPTSLNTTQLSKSMNSTRLVEGWNWGGGNLFGDIAGGLIMFYNTFRILILGFPDLLSAMSVPAPVSTALYVLWGFIWTVFVVEFISGRSVTGE